MSSHNNQSEPRGEEIVMTTPARVSSVSNSLLITTHPFDLASAYVSRWPRVWLSSSKRCTSTATTDGEPNHRKSKRHAVANRSPSRSLHRRTRLLSREISKLLDSLYGEDCRLTTKLLLRLRNTRAAA
jgi:hypothetical protein